MRAKPWYWLTSPPRVAFTVSGLVFEFYVNLYEERRWSAKAGRRWRFSLVLTRATKTIFFFWGGGVRNGGCQQWERFVSFQTYDLPCACVRVYVSVGKAGVYTLILCSCCRRLSSIHYVPSLSARVVLT